MSVAGSILGALLRSLIWSGSVFLICALVMLFSPALGAALMLVFSTWLLWRSARRPFRLNPLTALLPGTTATVCLGIQLLLPLAVPGLTVLGLLPGLLLGLLMGVLHRIRWQERRLVANRTLLATVLWGLPTLGTQIAALLGIGPVAAIGRVCSAAGSGMLIAISGVLLLRWFLRVLAPPPLTVRSLLPEAA